MFAQSTPTKKVRVSVEDLENVDPIEMHPERHVQSAEDELKRKNPGLRSLGFGVGKLLSFSPHKKLRDVNDGASVDFKARPGLKGGMDGAEGPNAAGGGGGRGGPDGPGGGDDEEDLPNDDGEGGSFPSDDDEDQPPASNGDDWDWDSEDQHGPDGDDPDGDNPDGGVEKLWQTYARKHGANDKLLTLIFKEECPLAKNIKNCQKKWFVCNEDTKIWTQVSDANAIGKIKKALDNAIEMEPGE